MASSKLKAKIAALKAKTCANGCSEAEAMAAAEKAARLMQDHGLDEADLVMTEASARERTVNGTWRTTLSAVIAYCTNTSSVLVVDRREGNLMVFIGRAPGPEIAVYLRDVCLRAVTAEVTKFKASTFYKRRRAIATRRQAVADFVQGLVQRLTSRLVELFAPTLDDAARTEAGNALQARFKGTVAQRVPERKTRYSEAAAQGWVAGGTVPLSHGVSGGAVPRQISGS